MADPALVTRLLYLGYYVALGSYLPFINLYYERIGLTGVQIGSLSAISLLVSSSTSIVWSSIADSHRLHRLILRTSLLLSPVPILLLSRASAFAGLLFLVIVYALFSSPISPLLDSAALDIVGRSNATCGGFRVWGTLGWVISTALVGVLIRLSGIQWLFLGYALFALMTFVFSLLQPRRARSSGGPVSSEFRHSFGQRPFLLSLFAMLLLAMTIGAANSFFSLYLDRLGASEGTIGIAWAVAAISEVPLILYSAGVMKRTGPEGLLNIAFVAYALRWAIYSSISSPAWILPVQLLQGVSFAAFQVGGVSFVNDRTPGSISTIGQAIFSTISYGLGSIAGSMVGGIMYDTVGMIAMFRILSVLAMGAFVVFRMASPRAKCVLLGL